MRFPTYLKLSLTLVSLAATSLAASAYIEHKVQRNETLWGLAKKYNVTPDDIVNANPATARGLKTGQIIRIPEASDLNGKVEPVVVVEAIEQPVTAPSENQTPAVELAEAESQTEVGEQTQPVADVIDTVDTSDIEADVAVPMATPEASLHMETPVVADPVVTVSENIYVARFGDTLESVARKTGVSRQTLLSLNPFAPMGQLPECYSVRLDASAPNVPYSAPVSLVDSILYQVQPVVPQDVEVNGTKAQTVAVMLPFDVDNETISRQSLLATDFYKGFLLALNDDARRLNTPLHILAIDTQCDSIEFDKRLSALANQQVTVIIPPDDERQLEQIERFALDNNIMVLNALNVKDEGYLKYPNVVQCNINQKLMYDKAISAIRRDYADYIPVILDLSGGKDEKASFVEELTRQYHNNGLEVVNLSIKNKLTQAELAQLSSKNKYLLIPKSGTLDVFNRVYEGLLEAVESDPVSERFKVFGYPDWITYRGEHAEALHRMGATIYSRFFLDTNDPVTRDVMDEFVCWYGNQMEEVYPSQGMLGYDTGRLLISKLRRPANSDGTPDFASGTSNGRQSSFRFIREGGGTAGSGGLINDMLYIIEFMPGELMMGRAL